MGSRKIDIWNYSEHFKTVCKILRFNKSDFEEILELFELGEENTEFFDEKSENRYHKPSKSRILSFFNSTESVERKNSSKFMTELEFNVFMIGVNKFVTDEAINGDFRVWIVERQISKLVKENKKQKKIIAEIKNGL